MSVSERYHEHKHAIHEFLVSTFPGVFDKDSFNDELLLEQSFKSVTKHYPFVELIFTLNSDGVQTSQNITNNIS